MRRKEIVLDAINKFPDLPIMSLAKYIFYTHGDAFDYNFDNIRTIVRFHLGKHGVKSRRHYKPRPVVKVPTAWNLNVKPHKINSGKWLVVSDIHIPFHDEKAIEACFRYGKEQGVTGVIINGDLQDYYSISFWGGLSLRNFDKEFSIVLDFLDYMRGQFPEQEIIWKPGNHELRLPRLYVQKMPEMVATPLLAMETLLNLNEKNIMLLDAKQLIYAGELPILHGHEIRFKSHIVNPARTLFLKIKQWGLMSHAHQTSEHTEKNLQGTYLTTWSTGCLCNLQPEWNPYGNNWNHGFAIVDVSKNGFFVVGNKRILPSGDIV
ncbi:MAG: hypothetical protein N2745_08430 [Syntrophorhabdaceae bacterium]|nr:hypothetical protein [Syntrophorhabdaceae bacterium]